MRRQVVASSLEGPTRGSVVSCAEPAAIGIDTAGKKSILAVEGSRSEAEVHWRDFLWGSRPVACLGSS